MERRGSNGAGRLTSPDGSFACEQEELYAGLHIVYARLDTLASIDAANILIHGGLQVRYHEIIKEAGAALGQVETMVDTLHEQLEYEHRRLDEARDAALKEAIEE